MLTRRDARDVRAAVLAPGNDISFEADVGGGGFWLVEGRGWFARMTNMRDLQETWPNSCGVRIEPDEATSYERLELFVDDRTEAALDLIYRIDGEDQRLVAYRAGRWEREFQIGAFRRRSPDTRKARALAALGG